MVEVEEENVEVVQLIGLFAQGVIVMSMECVWCKGLSTLVSSIRAAALDQGTAVTAYDTKFVMIHVL